MTTQVFSNKIKNYLNIVGAFTFRRTRTPLQLIHFVTARCNARCRHCFYWKEIDSKKNELSLDEIKKMSSKIGPIFFLLISGGEPFLRKDLSEIIKTYYYNNSVKSLSIPTNGILTKKIVNDCEKILKECPNINFSLSLSLDGLYEDHDLSRNHKGCFKKLINTFNEVSKLKSKYPNFSVSILTTITSFNQKKLKDLYFFVKNKLKPDIFQLNFIRGNPREPLSKDVDPKYYEEINKLEELDFNKKFKPHSINFKNFKLWIRNRLNKIRYNMIVDTVKENKFITRCYAGIYNVVINEQGDVYPCELLLNKKIGNIRDYNYDFKNLWNSKRAKNIRKYIKESKCFCTHECYVTTNILFNNKFIFRLLFHAK